MVTINYNKLNREQKIIYDILTYNGIELEKEYFVSERTDEVDGYLELPILFFDITELSIEVDIYIDFTFGLLNEEYYYAVFPIVKYTKKDEETKTLEKKPIKNLILKDIEDREQVVSDINAYINNLFLTKVQNHIKKLIIDEMSQTTKLSDKLPEDHELILKHLGLMSSGSFNSIANRLMTSVEEAVVIIRELENNGYLSDVPEYIDLPKYRFYQKKEPFNSKSRIFLSKKGKKYIEYNNLEVIPSKSKNYKKR